MTWLGKLRSQFNWTGPSSFEIEARRQLIQEHQQRLTGVKQSLSQSVQKLQTWQRQRSAFEGWERSPIILVLSKIVSNEGKNSKNDRKEILAFAQRVEERIQVSSGRDWGGDRQGRDFHSRIRNRPYPLYFEVY